MDCVFDLSVMEDEAADQFFPWALQENPSESAHSMSTESMDSDLMFSDLPTLDALFYAPDDEIKSEVAEFLPGMIASDSELSVVDFRDFSSRVCSASGTAATKPVKKSKVQDTKTAAKSAKSTAKGLAKKEPKASFNSVNKKKSSLGGAIKKPGYQPGKSKKTEAKNIALRKTDDIEVGEEFDITGCKVHRCPRDGCDKLFSRKHNLKVHMRRHTGEMPYQCPHNGCSKSFKWKSSLKYHERLHQRPNGKSPSFPGSPVTSTSFSSQLSKGSEDELELFSGSEENTM
uniref:C2H2-type domain-containing protein n=1 Tax=Timspurckia oligopyrenoides TaxID=708627 RepID=A0A7S0ZD01_9RHOD|mmetsp:Transcript_13008/g.23385  ORF Transcript_13008/g.23385 Transcript_13008/m.23385 type:complete len:287 (+) Transcript_13008:216-1076(+)|eukprot:CAMPEP_0182441932 /NCGR_PEP_ID=MMETSP1172-20130603/908_1 /TAXON_ID=708627 /ORGANISM="Timspurckia oligopyrenoides, Strain CCMP3278" /LENGTH=286 /DNA_ID=CAMNT_0024636535 /DNA_START=136 /DNA_END=996 /DNA_ORIENTATION=+